MNNFSRKERYSRLGVDVEVFTLRLANGMLYVEKNVNGDYGEFFDFSFGEITRYIWKGEDRIRKIIFKNIRKL